MRAIIAVAGKGTRLDPLTRYKPKVPLEVAGKPVLEHILENVIHSGIEEVVLIVGYMEERVRSWMLRNYGPEASIRFISQERKLGLGHAIQCAGELLSGEISVMLGDEIF